MKRRFDFSKTNLTAIGSSCTVEISVQDESKGFSMGKFSVFENLSLSEIFMIGLTFLVHYLFFEMHGLMLIPYSELYKYWNDKSR